MKTNPVFNRIIHRLAILLLLLGFGCLCAGACV